MQTGGCIVISGYRVQPVKIVDKASGFVVVEFPGMTGTCRIRIRESRLYATEEEAKAHLRKPDPPA